VKNPRIKNFQNRLYEGIPVGIRVRRSIAKRFIFRVRRGNGYYGSVAGFIYQDKMSYFVPPSTSNTKGEAARQAFASAVYNWRSVLTEEEKIEWNRKGQIYDNIPGYNLYIREYILANT